MQAEVHFVAIRHAIAIGVGAERIQPVIPDDAFRHIAHQPIAHEVVFQVAHAVAGVVKVRVGRIERVQSQFWRTQVAERIEHFEAVRHPVAIGIPLRRIGAELYFEPVKQAVPVGIGIQRVCPIEEEFVTVAESIAIRIKHSRI